MPRFTCQFNVAVTQEEMAEIKQLKAYGASSIEIVREGIKAMNQQVIDLKRKHNIPVTEEA